MTAQKYISLKCSKPRLSHRQRVFLLVSELFRLGGVDENTNHQTGCFPCRISMNVRWLRVPFSLLDLIKGSFSKPKAKKLVLYRQLTASVRRCSSIWKWLSFTDIYFEQWNEEIQWEMEKRKLNAMMKFNAMRSFSFMNSWFVANPKLMILANVIWKLPHLFPSAKCQMSYTYWNFPASMNLNKLRFQVHSQSQRLHDEICDFSCTSLLVSNLDFALYTTRRRTLLASEE